MSERGREGRHGEAEGKSQRRGRQTETDDLLAVAIFSGNESG